MCDGSQRWQLPDGTAMSTDASIGSRTLVRVLKSELAELVWYQAFKK